MIRSKLLDSFSEIEYGIAVPDGMPEGAVRGEQIHKDKSIWIGEQSDAVIPGVDALLSREIGKTLAVFSADCVPVLIYEPKRGIIGAIHAGWRGTALEITRKTIEALKMPPKDLRVVFGPAICQACFEVGEEVSRQFDPSVVKESEREEGKFHVDLWQANVNQCLELEIPEKHIEVIRVCTMETPELYSFRRGDRGAKRNFTWIQRKTSKSA